MKIGLVLVCGVISVATPVPAGASSGLTCEDFPTQIDVAGSNFGTYDSTNFDENDNGIGCEANPGPPTAYDLTKVPPTPITTTVPTTTPAPTTTAPPAAPTPEPARPVVVAPTFTG